MNAILKGAWSMSKARLFIQISCIFIPMVSNASNLKQFFGSSSSGGAAKYKCQEFTASGTWTRPANVDTVDLLLVGGGGGGGSAYASTVHSCGGGGGGGEVIKKPVSVSGDVSVTIGAGGTGSTGAAAGGVGQNSVFGTVTARGGGGGSSYWSGSFFHSTSAATSGGAGMQGASYIACGPGGGAGGNASVKLMTSMTLQTVEYSAWSRNAERGAGGIAFDSMNMDIKMGDYFGGPGIDGFGGGGSAFSHSAWAAVVDGGGKENTAGVANKGGGGSGAYASAGASASGRNGGSGFARVCWWE